MSALEGIADELGEAEHVADVPSADMRPKFRITMEPDQVPEGGSDVLGIVRVNWLELSRGHP
jgi:hypothetical protein